MSCFPARERRAPRLALLVLAALAVAVLASPAGAQTGSPPSVAVDPAFVNVTLAPGESTSVNKFARVSFGLPSYPTTVSIRFPPSCTPATRAVQISFDRLSTTLQPLGSPSPPQTAFFTETISVARGTPAGTYRCTVVFEVRDQPPGSPTPRQGVGFPQTVTITVPSGGNVRPSSVAVTVAAGQSTVVRKEVDTPVDFPGFPVPSGTLVTPSATCSSPAVSVTFNPPSALVAPTVPGSTGGTGVFDETIAVAPGTPAGTYTCTARFLLAGSGGGSSTEEQGITVTVPAAPTPSTGCAEGIGQLQSNLKAAFAFRVSGGAGAAEPKGAVAFADKAGGRYLTSTRLTSLVIVGKAAQIRGLGPTNGGQTVQFSVDVSDLSANGRLDTFSITWTGYAASGTLRAGDIDVPCEQRSGHEDDDD